MALTPTQKAKKDIYMDMVQPNTAQRHALAASDEILIQTIEDWITATGLPQVEAELAQAQHLLLIAQESIKLAAEKKSILTRKG